METPILQEEEAARSGQTPTVASLEQTSRDSASFIEAVNDGTQ